MALSYVPFSPSEQLKADGHLWDFDSIAKTYLQYNDGKDLAVKW